ncbi:hypothetical protein BDR26DRAFT_941370 [Obelidium mucronatum]|nr:hypothetical protein BDR26DRAFT_941370 [Obelidium mucronatum]
MNPPPPAPTTTTTGTGTQQQTVVGGFTICEEIGRGSFATVFLGVKEGQRVAVKTVSREKLNRKLAENLESEIRIMQQVRHVNIVGLLDIVKTERHIHLLMEFCTLGDLSQFIRRKGRVAPHGHPPPLDTGAPALLASPWGGVNEAVARHFLAQLGAALETSARPVADPSRLEAPGAICFSTHRLKTPRPLTILSPYLNTPPFTIPALPILKLADFGFARALPQQSLASTLCGSPLYMAPEILRGDRYDAKVDLWSLGTILYEMITGRPPFKAQNHIDLLRKIDKGEGWIKFPGDEELPNSRKSVLVAGSQPHPSAISSSLGRRVMNNFPAASLGASPKFPVAGQPGMIGVRPISDDLKDLTRRLLKRNPIERMSFEEFFMHSAVVVGASQIDVGLNSAQPTLEHSANTSIPDSSLSDNKQTSINAPRLRDATDAPINPLLPDPSSTPFPPATKPTLQTFQITIPPLPQNSNPLLFLASAKDDNLFDDLEPPFAGYDLDPQKHSSVSPTRAKNTPKTVPEEDVGMGSSISSLGSLELSEEMEQEIKSKSKGTSATSKADNLKPVASIPASGNSTPKTKPLLPSKQSNSISPTRSSGGAGGGGGLKSSFEDFEIIETASSRPAEVNWLETAGNNGISEAMQTHTRAPIHNTTASNTQNSGPFSKRSSIASGGISASPPTSPFSKRLGGESLKGSRSSFDRATGIPIASNAVPSITPTVGSAGSGGTGFHEYGTRVFGSLRDSTHNFLDSINQQQHQLSGRNQAGTASQTSSANGGVLPGTSPSPTTQWTAELQDEANLLTILNLSTLRGHALHTFADEYHRDLCLMVQNRVQEVPEEHRNENHAIEETSSSNSSPTVATTTPDSPARKEYILAEETLSLYLSTLRLYQFGLESARALWSREQTRIARTQSGASPQNDSIPGTSEVAIDLQSLNASVQWMKDKYDDCLERAQEVKGVMNASVAAGGGTCCYCN